MFDWQLDVSDVLAKYSAPGATVATVATLVPPSQECSGRSDGSGTGAISRSALRECPIPPNAALTMWSQVLGRKIAITADETTIEIAGDIEIYRWSECLAILGRGLSNDELQHLHQVKVSFKGRIADPSTEGPWNHDLLFPGRKILSASVGRGP